MVHIIVAGDFKQTAQNENTVIVGLGHGTPVSITTNVYDSSADMASIFADSYSIKIHEFPVDWSNGNKSALFDTNRFMVRESRRRYGDNLILLIFIDKPLEQSKAMSSLEAYATRRGVTVHCYRLDLNRWSY